MSQLTKIYTAIEDWKTLSSSEQKRIARRYFHHKMQVSKDIMSYIDRVFVHKKSRELKIDKFIDFLKGELPSGIGFIKRFKDDYKIAQKIVQDDFNSFLYKQPQEDPRVTDQIDFIKKTTFTFRNQIRHFARDIFGNKEHTKNKIFRDLIGKKVVSKKTHYNPYQPGSVPTEIITSSRPAEIFLIKIEKHIKQLLSVTNKIFKQASVMDSLIHDIDDKGIIGDKKGTTPGKTFERAKIFNAHKNEISKLYVQMLKLLVEIKKDYSKIEPILMKLGFTPELKKIFKDIESPPESNKFGDFVKNNLPVISSIKNIKDSPEEMMPKAILAFEILFILISVKGLVAAGTTYLVAGGQVFIQDSAILAILNNYESAMNTFLSNWPWPPELGRVITMEKEPL